MNIEVKTPQERAVRERYDYEAVTKIVYELIQKYEMASQCCVSSFNHSLLAYVEHLNQLSKINVETIYLYNYYDSDELPHPSVYTN